MADNNNKDINISNDNNTDETTMPPIKEPVGRNRFQPNSRYFTIVMYALLFVLGSILIYNFVGNFSNTLRLIGSIASILSPFFIGGFIALVLYPLVHLLYHRLFMEKFKCKSQKLAKWLSILITYLVAIGVIAILLTFIVPQIYESIREITEQLPNWYDNALAFLNSYNILGCPCPTVSPISIKYGLKSLRLNIST